MATIFTRIISGELPGRFVYRDDTCVAFLSIAPIQPGHTLVVPIEEVDHWVDASPALNAHLMEVAHLVARAQMEAFSPSRVGLIIAGLEVPHLHVHVIPMRGMQDLDFSNADASPAADALDAAADALRAALGSAAAE